jgi:hypothetical protein
MGDFKHGCGLCIPCRTLRVPTYALTESDGMVRASASHVGLCEYRPTGDKAGLPVGRYSQSPTFACPVQGSCISGALREAR